MELIETFTVKCCDLEWSYEHKYQALEVLLSHIQNWHSQFFESLNNQGRMLARSQNGSGYWDSDTRDGWSNAHEEFRHAWTINALEKYLISQKK
jgi:hypothetical protein